MTWRRWPVRPVHGFPLVFDLHEVGRIAREGRGSLSVEGSAQTATVDEYLAYGDLVIDFIEAQNSRIAKRKADKHDFGRLSPLAVLSCLSAAPLMGP